MRISAWSSDVCSSDLADILPPRESSSFLTSAYLDDGVGRECIFRHFEIGGRRAFADARGGIVMGAVAGAEIAAIFAARSAEGRVGKGGFMTCRSRWSTLL